MKTFVCSIFVLFALFIFNSCQQDLVTQSTSENVSDASPKSKMSTPTLTCATSTQASIDITVTAGPTGAPAGFSLQWMTAAAYAANGNQWLPSEDPGLCKASFSGNANASRYNLAAGGSVTIRVGDILIDNGASTNCPDVLICGTEYVFRVFAHANSSLQRSEFTATLTCSTLSCGGGEGCTLSQGYWKNHNDLVCITDPTSPLCVQWPVTTLTLGTVSYNQTQLVSILNQNPSGGNGLVSLAHQVIAVKLSIANGADGTSIAATLAAADALIGSLVIPPVGSGFLASSSTSALTLALDTYIGLNHCP